MGGPQESKRKAVVVRPGEGRAYELGRMRAVFFVDGDEADGQYSISEWSIEAATAGPGAHSHPDDHVFYVLEGTLRLEIDGQRQEAPRGSYAVIPGGVSHDFDNPGAEACRFISINLPAGFEQMMPRLVDFFADNPLGDAAR